MPQLAERLRLDLPDALAGHREALTDFLERVFAAFAHAEAHLDYALLARRQRLEDVVRLFLEVEVDDRIRRRHDVRVRDEVAKMRIFLFSDRRLERDGFLSDLEDLAHLGYRDVHALCD